jgi:hypothetical protein
VEAGQPRAHQLDAYVVNPIELNDSEILDIPEDVVHLLITNYKRWYPIGSPALGTTRIAHEVFLHLNEVAAFEFAIAEADTPDDRAKLERIAARFASSGLA